jgi:hypothetical protein
LIALCFETLKSPYSSIGEISQQFRGTLSADPCR